MPSQRLLLLILLLAASACSLPARRTLVGARVPRLAASVATCDRLDVAALSIQEETADASPPSAAGAAGFFEEQLEMCRGIVRDDELGLQVDCVAGKFKEHPRCTARFGEVLLHARDSAGSDDEYQRAVYNARSVVRYVDTCREDGNDSHPIREGLVSAIVAALASKSLRRFRARQIEDAPTSLTQRKDSMKSDFTPEDNDIEIMGRLYYSAIMSNGPSLDEVGLTPDHGGFTALLALCRAASSHNPGIPDEEAALDAALSNHFNGIVAPGNRFLFSRRHGLDEINGASRARHLIVAFSSLGNGLVRHEFGGSLAKLNHRLLSDGHAPFDVLFVADPSQSWYQKSSRGTPDGFVEYERRLRVASRPYERISLVGDSMGGSAALLFSHLATDSVLAFSPQVELRGDGHVSRYDMTTGVRDRYLRRLLRSVSEAARARVRVVVHRGTEEADVGHTDLLMSRLPDASTECVKVVEHWDCDHHQVATHLKSEGRLAEILSSLTRNRKELAVETKS